MPYQCGAWNYFNSFGWGWAPGGCNPWWGGGGWGYLIGNAPYRYQPPRRPRGGPVRPRGGAPVKGGQSYPVVAVNRLHNLGSETPLRDRNAPLLTGGNLVHPIRPVSTLDVYKRQMSVQWIYFAKNPLEYSVRESIESGEMR